MDTYNKQDKRYIYMIIDQFLLGEIDEKTFCDEYYYSYDLELDYSVLTEKEKLLFFELSDVVSRFSEYPEDYRLDPKAFTTKEALRKKIIETKLNLK